GATNIIEHRSSVAPKTTNSLHREFLPDQFVHRTFGACWPVATNRLCLVLLLARRHGAAAWVQTFAIWPDGNISRFDLRLAGHAAKAKRPVIAGATARPCDRGEHASDDCHTPCYFDNTATHGHCGYSHRWPPSSSEWRCSDRTS